MTIEDCFLKNCDKCNGMGIFFKPSKRGMIDVSVCQCKQDCFLCRGERYVPYTDDDGQMIGVECTPKGIYENMNKVKFSNLPFRCTRMKFDHKPYADQLLKIIDEQRNAFILQDRMKYMKAMVAVILKGYTLKYLTKFALDNAYREAGFSMHHTNAVTDPYCTCDVLVIDWLGDEKKNKYISHMLDVMITRRYNSKRPIFILDHPNEVRTRLSEYLFGRLNEDAQLCRGIKRSSDLCS